MKCFGKVNAHGFRFLFIFLLNSLEREAGVTQEAKGSFLPHWQVFLTQCVPGRWRGAAGPGLSCPSGSRRLRSAAGTHKLSESPDRQERQKLILVYLLCVMQFTAADNMFREEIFPLFLIIYGCGCLWVLLCFHKIWAWLLQQTMLIPQHQKRPNKQSLTPITA